MHVPTKIRQEVSVMGWMVGLLSLGGCRYLKVGRLGALLKQCFFFHRGFSGVKRYGELNTKDMFLQVCKSFGIDGTDDPKLCDEYG